MKKTILLFIFYFACFALGQHKQDYHLSWDGTSPILKVKLIYKPTNKDSTIFLYADAKFGGQTDIFKVVKNIKCNGKDYLRINEQERLITVYHQDKNLKMLTYEIDGSMPEDKKPSIYTELFRPVITNGFFSSVNDFYMMKTPAVNDAEISFIWDKYPQKYTYFNSLSPGILPNKKIIIKQDSWGRSLMVMGNKIAVKKYSVTGVPYYSITSTEESYKILEEALPPFFKNYFPSIRNFWNDKKGPFYFVAILPLQYAGKTGGGGFGMDNGFMMKYKGDFNVWEKEVVAHETSHYWIGLKLKIGNDSFDHQWFGEGFNDYVTIINLVKSNVFTPAEFLEYLNKHNFRDHYSSKVKDSSNASIAKNYWTDYQNFGRLPYRRGLIYAFYLDSQIRLNSNGNFTLRNFLLNLLDLENSKIEYNENGIALEEFIRIGSRYIPKNKLENEIETYMLKGTPIDFKQVKLIPEFEVYFENEIPQIKLSPKADLKKIYYW